MEKFELDELVKLATDLPFDAEAAVCVFPRQYRWSRTAFLEHITDTKDKKPKLGYGERERYGDRPENVRAKQRFKQGLATYCAAAAQGAIFRVNEELLRLARLKLEVVKQLHGVKTVADKKGAEAFKQLLKGQAE